MADVMEKKRGALSTLLEELKAFQEKYTGGEVPDAKEAEAMDAKAAEASALQDEITEYDNRVKNLHGIIGAGVPSPVLPNPRGGDHPKAERDRIAGFMRLGEYISVFGGMKDFEAQGMPKANFPLARVPTLYRGPRQRDIYVAVDRAQRGKAEEFFLREAKAVPTLGAGVIDPERFDMVRVTEHDQLTLRDILNVVPTTSNAVEWVRLVNYTRAADPTAHGAQKPEADIQFDLATSTVRTIAVWMPVQDQQLSDFPQLQALINGELLYDLEKRVEELVCWGDGLGQNFLGFFLDPLIWACGQMTAAGATRVVGTDTLIDIIRRGITDVRVAGYSPNAVLVHPYDWERIELLKATDNKYIWAIVNEAGVSRLWGVRVVETEACADFTGAAIEQRNLLVGDFTRGATLYDRMQSQVDVGWINDQFIRNMRTLRGELRAAFAIRRPGAFRDYQTQAAVES